MPADNVYFDPGSNAEQRRYYQGTSIAPFTPVTVVFDTDGDWVDFRVGSTLGGEELFETVRLWPGKHCITYTPTATHYFYFTAAGAGRRTVGPPTVQTPAGRFGIAAPWAVADARAIKLAQLDDALWMAHPDYQTHVLQRLSSDGTSWSLWKYRPTEGPFLPINLTNIVVAPSARIGNGQLVAFTADGENAALFKPGHVGALWKCVHPGQVIDYTASANNDYTAPIRVFGIDQERIFRIVISGTFVATVQLQRSVGNPDDFRDVSGSTWAAGVDTTYDDGFDNQIIYYRLKITAYTSGSPALMLDYNSGSTTGVCRITAYISAGLVDMQVLRQFGRTTSTRDWYEGAWSDVRGWPEAVEFDSGRLWLVGGLNRWATEPDDYLGFRVSDDDDGAIARVATTGKSSRAKWIKSAGRLVVGSQDIETIVGSGALEEPVTPTNLTSRQVTGRGSNGVDARVVDQTVLWPNATGMRLYALSLGAAPLIADMTRLHTTIAAGGFIDGDMQTEPEPRWWGLRDDGQIAVLLFNAAEEVVGWQRWRREGDMVRSLGVVPGTPEDRIFLVVDREIDGVTRRFFEVLELERWTDLEDVHRLHCAIEYEGAATSTLTGLGHLEGMDVIAWANGRAVEGTVSGGALSLGFSATKAQVGLEARATYVTGRLAYGAGLGAGLMAKKKVQKVGIELLRTPPGILWLGAFVDDPDGGYLADRIGDGLTMDSELQTASGLQEEKIAGDYNIDARFCLQAHKAGPATVLCLVLGMDGGRE